MNAPFNASEVSRRALLKGGALTIAFAMSGTTAALLDGAAAQGAPARNLDPNSVDAFFSIGADGRITLYCGKVDLGTGLRAAIPQMAAEELGVDPDQIDLVTGDTALTPDQGATAGSTGIARGGVQIRRAAATARQALLGLAAKKFNIPASDLEIERGERRPERRRWRRALPSCWPDKKLDLKIDPKAPLKDPTAYRLVGKPLPRPDVPAKCTGTFPYVHNFTLPGMLHGRTIRPPAIGATLVSVDDSGLKDLKGVARRAHKRFSRRRRRGRMDLHPRAARAESAVERVERTSGARRISPTWCGAWQISHVEALPPKAATVAAAAGAKSLKATYFWPMQSHASLGPSCAVADVRDGEATVWTASQATHRFAEVFAKMLGMPQGKVRMIYMDGAGCYGMNGHDDAAADAALLSRAVGKPVRVQWMREDEHGWDPKGPPQLLDLSGTVNPDGKIVEWRVDMWVPEATRGLPNVPLLAPVAAGIAQTPGLSTGLLTQNAETSYDAPAAVTIHWLKEAPLRPSNIRAPGKVANSLAVEGFVDELAAAAGLDALDMRLRSLSDPRGVEVLKRTAAMMNWQARPSPAPAAQRRGRAWPRHRLRPLQATGKLCRNGHGGRRRSHERQGHGRARGLRP